MVLSNYLQADGAKLYYEISGRGEPLVLLHAGIADHRMWQYQIDAFAKRYQVITLDFRDYGKSIHENGAFWHYKDVHSLIGHLGLNSANILGCSLGGMVTLELAIQHPEVVNKIVLLAPGLRGYKFTDELSLEKDKILDELLALDKKEEASELLVDIWVVGLGRKREDVQSEIKSFVKEMILDNYEAVVEGIAESKLGFDVIPRLNDIKTKTLVIVGEEDLPEVLKISEIITEKIPQAKRTIIPDVAHMINLEKGGHLVKEVLSFLSNN
jgi:3-oxoadipate enol-lactonase